MGARYRSVFVVFAVCLLLPPACSGKKSDTKKNPNPANYSCDDACDHMWWCGLIDLEAATNNCPPACQAGTYGAGWVTCVRDTVGCPSTFECTGISSTPQFPVCENVCRLGYECGMISALEIGGCKTECDELLVEIPSSVQDCMRAATSCTGLRHCVCTCDNDATCVQSCACDPECSTDECPCDTDIDCSADCPCDPEC